MALSAVDTVELTVEHQRDRQHVFLVSNHDGLPCQQLSKKITAQGKKERKKEKGAPDSTSLVQCLQLQFKLDVSKSSR